MLIERRRVWTFFLTAVAGWLAGPISPANAAEDANPPRNETAAADNSQVVYVGRSLGWAVYDGWETRSPTLLRELARQALIMAARDELGLDTRDPWLGSELPTTGDNSPFEIIAASGDGDGIEVLRGFGGQQEVLLRLPLKVKQLEKDVPEFIVDMEAASRKTFVDMLKKNGFRARAAAAAKPRSNAVDLETPEKIERRLVQLDEYSQFAALRALHARLSQGGETSELLGQLVRGYAQLGVLTELCWAPTHKVFKARALLYAQQMMQKYPSPAAFDHLALAEAYCGLPGAALETLAKAKAASEADKPKQDGAAKRAPWHAAIDAYCRLDTDALEKMTDDLAIGNLAGLLKFMALEQSGSYPLAVEYGLNLIQTTLPECFRVYAGLNRIAGVGIGHIVTETAPAIFAQGFREHLLNLPNLPPTVLDALDSGAKARAKVAQLGNAWKLEAAAMTALLEGGRLAEPDAKAEKESADAKPAEGARGDAWHDDNELRWETLGLVLRDVAWEQVWQRARFLRTMLGVSPDDWLQEIQPLTDVHPYGPFLQFLHWEKADRERFVAAVCESKPLGIELPGLWLGFELQAFNRPKGEEFMADAMRNSDETAFELTQKMTWTNHDESLDGRAWRLLAVSPHSPIAQARLVTRAFDKIHDQADAWEQATARHPQLAMGFAKHYAADDPERAKKLFRSAATLSHDVEAYTQLAAIYDKEGDEDRWLATLKEFLKQPAFGLEHSLVQIKIADHYIGKGEWALARPYAEDAAESYSGAGLYKAARVNEALRQWSKAEEYYQAVSNRYRGENLAWYYFCRRTGHGSEAAARRVAAAFVAAGNVRPWALGTFYELDKQPDKALLALDQAAAAEPHPYSLMAIATIADREKQTERRDAALNKISAAGKGIVPDVKLNNGAELVMLADLFIDDLAKGGKAEFEVPEFEKRLTGKNVRGVCNFHWFLGCYLDRCGKSEAAIEQWKQCLACPAIDSDVRTLAGAALGQHNIHDTDYENPLVKTKENAAGP